MFRSKDKGNAGGELSGRSYSVVSNSVVFTGEIQANDDLRIDGSIEGNILCKGRVIVGATGCVKGRITTNSLELVGKVEGEVDVADIIILRASSYFQGEITATNVEIEAGASFFGNCKMADNSKIDIPSIGLDIVTE